MGGGGQKFVHRRVQAVGRTNNLRPSSFRTVMQLTVDSQVGGSIPGRPTAVGAAIGRPGFEPPICTRLSAALPLDRCAFCSSYSPHCLKPSLPLKNPKLCVSVYLPACPTDCLIDCLPD